jgi:flagellar basal-body rod protein FlgF
VRPIRSPDCTKSGAETGMDQLTIAAASGLRSRMESLEMLANNISNANTAGYKADREFYSLYAAAEAQADGNAATLPVVERNWTDFTQGTLTDTGNPLDVALSGKGFFAVNSPGGALYTRTGSFRISSSGVLQTPEGYPLRAVGGKAIKADPNLPVDFKTNGEVSQAGEVLGRLELVEFSRPEALAKQGGNYFRLASADSKASPAAGVELHQGKLESSNANPAECAIRLVSVMRQFEMLQRALTLGGEMNRRAAEEVARVNS